MSVQFDCLVDTTEMAREVGSVKHHVDATTTAVVGMQAAVIKAQKDGADNVCRKVNEGFYTLIHSQISQKMAKLQSKVDAQLMRLNQQRKQLLAIKGRMERDYQLLAARYTKLFNGLNRNLRQRITELDRPVLDFATVEADKVINRTNQLVSGVPIGQTESVTTAQNVAASNLKYKASKALGSIERFIGSSNRLQSMIDKVLLGRPMHVKSDILSVPVGIIESNFDDSNNVETRVYVPSTGMSGESRQAIESYMSNMQRTGQLSWQRQSSINPEVVNRFRQLVASSGLSQRCQKQMLQMCEQNPFETLR